MQRTSCGSVRGARDLFYVRRPLQLLPVLGFAVQPVPALLVAHEGALAGQFSQQDSCIIQTARQSFTETGGKSLRDVRTVAEDSRGAIWFGMSGNGLIDLENGQIGVSQNQRLLVAILNIYISTMTASSAVERLGVAYCRSSRWRFLPLTASRVCPTASSVTLRKATLSDAG